MYAMCRGIVTFETPNLFSGSKARTFRGLGTGAQNQAKNFSGGGMDIFWNNTFYFMKMFRFILVTSQYFVDICVNM